MACDVRRGLLLAGLVSVLAALVGCDGITGWIDGRGALGSAAAGRLRRARIAFALQGNVACNDLDGRMTVVEEGELRATFQGSGTYVPSTRTITATWDGGSFADTLLEITLDGSRDHVERFVARQTRVHTFGAWTEVYEIAGHGIPYHHSYGSWRCFATIGAGISHCIDAIVYAEWSLRAGSVTNPRFGILPPARSNIWGDAASFIEICIEDESAR